MDGTIHLTICALQLSNTLAEKHRTTRLNEEESRLYEQLCRYLSAFMKVQERAFQRVIDNE